LEENDKPVLIYATFPDRATAEAVGGALVDRGLVACVNILPGMISIYVWEGQRQRSSEVVMIAKTRDARAEEAMAALVSEHPYDNPAVLLLPVMAGAEEFCAWIASQTGGGRT
jgi:periplasmic divalent cation tolerance protein